MTASRFPPRRPTRQAPGPPPALADTVTWTREVEPRELYRITYSDRNDQVTVRDIELRRLGHGASPLSADTVYLGAFHLGKFKSLRADRLLAVEQLSHGHAPSIHPWPQPGSFLPPWPAAPARQADEPQLATLVKIPTVVRNVLVPRTWTVDLLRYTCTCPERRLRLARGYAPGQLGAVCPHLARAILENLPTHFPSGGAWPAELLQFLRNPRNVHLDNLR